jgi:hypothetical protein
MSVGSHRRRLVPRPPEPRCIQCQLEDQIPNRPDKLGINCATYKDKSLAKVAKGKTKRQGDD